MPQAIASFLAREDGAVTVDWVVLAAALTGLALAVMAVVSGGLDSQSGYVDRTLRSGDRIRTSFERVADAVLGAILDTGFDTGRDGWAGGALIDAEGFGEILQIGTLGEATLSVDVPPGARSATVQFDLIGVNDLSGESAVISIDGHDIAIYTDDHGNISYDGTARDGSTVSALDGVSVSVSQQYTNDHMGGGRVGADSRATYTITIDNPADSFSLGVRSTSPQGIEEEYFALDDVSVRAD